MAYITVPAFVTGVVATAAQLEALRTNQLLDPTAIATTKGDLFVATAANVITRLAVGANGLFPVADSGEASGILWAVLATRNVISPSQITSNQNDYNPTGLATASMLRLSTDASRNITSIATGTAGRILFIHNVGSFSIVLKDDDGATGTAANRLALTADITLTADSVVILQYDATTSRWRAIAGGGGGGGTGGTPALTLGTSNTDGASGTFVETDAAIAIFDATDPTTQAFADSATVGSAAFAARRDHKHGMPNVGGATAFRFHDDDLTASGTSVAMNIPGDTGLTEIAMPYAGSIVAVSVACQNARTAGTATFKPTVNGTESSTLSAVLNGTNTQYHSGTQAAGVDTFTANQRVGVKVTTDGSWAAGTTPSVDVEVWILPSVNAASGGMTLIADTTLGASAADITFSSIPGTYKHLLVMAQLRGAAAVTQDTLRIQFNADTGNNYDYSVTQHNDGNSSVVGVNGNAVAFIRAGTLTGNSAPAGSASSLILDIPNYAGTTFHKSCQSETMDRYNTSSITQEFVGGNWRSTSAITSIKIYVGGGGNLLTGSRATLWGLS